MSSYPDLQVVLNWSVPGSFLAEKLSSDPSQLFAFGAMVGVVSDWRGYKSEGYPVPKYGYLIAGILAGYLGTHPILGYTKTSIVIGSLAYPTYIVYKELRSMFTVKETLNIMSLPIQELIFYFK